MSFAIVGHRGVMARFPENSLESYAAAEALGVAEIELDVRVSSDGELFLLHDATLDRTAGNDAARGLGPVSDLTIEELRQAVLDSGRSVVTLAEMYDATTTFIQLEIKDPAVVPLLPAFFEDRPQDASRTMITGFDADALRDAAEQLPTVSRGIIVSTLEKAEAFPGGWQGLLDYTRSTRFHCGFEGLTPEIVDMIHGLGLEVHGWPMRSEADMRRAVELGVDGTTADDPALAAEWLLRATEQASSAR